MTEHQAYACRCGACGRVTRAAFPAGVNAPVQYGPRVAATAAYLQNAHFLPEERLAELFQDVFGVAICAATLAGVVARIIPASNSQIPPAVGGRVFSL